MQLSTKVVLVNYEELMDGCKAIAELCMLLELLDDFMWTWIHSYLERNVEIGFQ